MAAQWKLKPYNELTIDELYEIIRLRVEIFVIEQNCPYQDLDGKDKKSLHLFLQEDDGSVLACLRIIPAGISYDEPSLGRFVVKESFRRNGLGRIAMEKGIEYITNNYNIKDIRISGQAYLREFYESLGFEVTKGPYLEDDIPHFQMLRTWS